MELRAEHPVYWHDGTGIRIWSGAEPSGGSSYTLPPATASTLGGVKVGSGLSVTSDGTLSASGGGGGGGWTDVSSTFDAIWQDSEVLLAWDTIALENGNMVYVSGELNFEYAGTIAFPAGYQSSVPAAGAALDMDTGYPAVCWFDGENLSFMEKDGGSINNCHFSLLFKKGT